MLVYQRVTNVLTWKTSMGKDSSKQLCKPSNDHEMHWFHFFQNRPKVPKHMFRLGSYYASILLGPWEGSAAGCPDLHFGLVICLANHRQTMSIWDTRQKGIDSYPPTWLAIQNYRRLSGIETTNTTGKPFTHIVVGFTTVHLLKLAMSCQQA